MSGLGTGLAWLGFWLFLGASCVGLELSISARNNANALIETECIKAGRAMGKQNWFSSETCLNKEDR